MKTDKILKCENLSYNIGYRKILKDIRFEIFTSDCISLMGDNGSGKSTLLRILANHSKFEKSIFWQTSSKRKFPISYLGHELGLYSSLSLKENLDYFLKILDNRVEKKRLDYVLEIFRLEKRLYDPIHTFSRGMKQKAALMRALLVESRLLLLDEPFSGLDSKSSHFLVELLKNFVKCDSMVIITHNLDILSELTNKHFFLKGGKLAITQSPNS
ncbi:MAG: ABC transporter ATP-binding protein [Leptospiraceae bacterium]|nr:ABC transporter ATP-binding protein [Leptospiraceae bacterium]MCP5497866.1 ABC transporter ATP-binding protein [Leptospiraceae bacterium]